MTFRGSRLVRFEVTTKSWLWALTPIWSIGFATPFVVAWAAVRLRIRIVGLSALVFAAGAVTMLATAPKDPNQNPPAFVAAVAVNLFLGGIETIALRRAAFGLRNDRPRTLKDKQRAALEKVREQEKARERARAVVQRNPREAAELHIGRPDLGRRSYPDGGLVDVNHVAAGVLTKSLGLPAALAAHVVEIRDRVSGFDSYDDMLMLLGSDGRDLAEASDRMLFLKD